MDQESWYPIPLSVFQIKAPDGRKLSPNAVLVYAVICGTQFNFKKPCYKKGLKELANEVGMGKGRDQMDKILNQLETSGILQVDREMRTTRIKAVECADVPRKPFIRAYGAILKRKDLKANAKIIWFYIESFTEKDGAFFGNHNQLHEVLNIGKVTARYTLSDLRERGLVEDAETGIKAVFPVVQKPDAFTQKPDEKCSETGRFNKMSFNESNKVSGQSIVLNHGNMGIDSPVSDFTAAPEMATAPPGTPKKTGEDGNPMSAPPPMASTQEDAPAAAAPMPDTPPKHSADESAAPTRASEERPTAPIIPDLTLKTREEREISAIDQILADGFNGFWPRLTEYQTWFDFWEERKWKNMEHPDYFMDFRTHHREQIRRDMPKDEAFRRKWRETEPQRREHNKPEFEAKLHQLKERITAA